MTAPEHRNSGLDANARGIVVIVVAVAVGLLLLAKANGGGGGTADVSTGKDGSKTTTTIDIGGLGDATTTTTEASSGKAHPIGEVKVLVLNGSGKTGVARANSAALGSAGYDMVPPTDANQMIDKTTVFFAEGYEADAKEIAGRLGKTDDVVQPKPATPLGTGSDTANVVVVLGGDVSPATEVTSTTTG